MTIPCAIALVVIPMPLVSVLFERGATTADDSAAIAVAVAIYGLGLPAFVVQKILQPLFFAREDTKTPFRYALWAMFVNAVVAIGLAPLIGWIAPAIATTLAAWVMVALLYKGTRPMGYVAKFDERLRRRLPRICLASAIMGGTLWALTIALARPLARMAGAISRWALLIFGGCGGSIRSGHIIGAFKLSDFRRAARRA